MEQINKSHIVAWIVLLPCIYEANLIENDKVFQFVKCELEPSLL